MNITFVQKKINFDMAYIFHGGQILLGGKQDWQGAEDPLLHHCVCHVITKYLS